VLTYDYGTTLSNQLLKVSDAADKTKGFIEPTSTSGNDYTYDVNGNMTVDQNKGITAIAYNHLNLPKQVTKNTNEFIKYAYDAGGRKIRQEVYNASSVLVKKTDYDGEYIYENDTLKFINAEEGRVIMTGPNPEYQYHLKDHLGNVRTTFTTKAAKDINTATLEDANLTAEQSKFLRYTNAKRVNATIFDHTNGSSTGYSERLNGSTNERYGVARSLSVMPGDTIHLEVYGKYVDSNTGNWTGAFNTLMGQIAAGAGGVVVDGASYSSSTSSFPFPGVVTTTGSSGGPQAYMNWIIYDRDYNLVDFGYRRLSTAAKEYGQDVAHERLFVDTIRIRKPGYVYAFLSNEESTAVEVYFDDFKVTQVKSPVIQTDDYYPFGLTFNEYQRESSLVNNYQYNGKEKQDELNLGWLDYGARMYMPEIGRWGTVDPLTDKMRRWSNYNYSFDNPLRFIDPDGMGPIEIYDVSGKKIGQDKDGADGKVSVVQDKKTAKRIEKESKDGKIASSADVALGVQTTKTELKEALDVLKRSDGNGDTREESSAVTENGEVSRGEPGPAESETIGGQEVKTAEIPHPDGDDNTSIHSHTPTGVVTGRDGQPSSTTAAVPGPLDPGTFSSYKRNIIVGNLSMPTSQTDQFGKTTFSTPQRGAVFYDRNSVPTMQLTTKAMQNIIR
jgi:RHS repeat-associated protein